MQQTRLKACTLQEEDYMQIRTKFMRRPLADFFLRKQATANGGAMHIGGGARGLAYMHVGNVANVGKVGKWENRQRRGKGVATHACRQRSQCRQCSQGGGHTCM